MRQAFAHEAVVRMDHHGDIQAPGAAVTVALCGSWEHEPPCPLASHHTEAFRIGEDVSLRILFATDVEHEAEVRQCIDRALSVGRLVGPDGASTRWQVVVSRRSVVSSTEADHVHRLTTD